MRANITATVTFGLTSLNITQMISDKRANIKILTVFLRLTLLSSRQFERKIRASNAYIVTD